MSTAHAQWFYDTLTTPNPFAWTINQSTPGLYSYEYASNGLTVNNDTATGNPGGPQNIDISLNLAAIQGGDSNFVAQVDISNMLVGPSAKDQIELKTSYADGSQFDVIYGNTDYSAGVSVWNGSTRGSIPSSATSGELQITRFDSVEEGYFAGRLIFLDHNSSLLTNVDLEMDSNGGANDESSTTFHDFGFTPAQSVPEPAPIAACAIGLVGLASWRKRKNT